MQDHFNFGHTITIDEDNSSDDNLQNLFKIGTKKIQLQPINNHNAPEDSQSDSTVKGKRIKKQKKEKKHRKEHKTKKQEKKRDKHRHRERQANKRQVISIQSQENSQEQNHQQLELYNKAQRQEKLQKYELLMRKSYEQELQKQFELNVKLGQGLLNVDIIKFPQNNLYLYGLMDKDIPQYSRLQNFYQIIGIKKSKQKKYKHIIKDLNKIINQKNINPNEDQISKNRYFDYQGYEKCGLQKLRPQKRINEGTVIKFSLSESSGMSDQERIMQINKQYNRKLNQNLKQVDLWIQFVNIQDSVSQSIGMSKNRVAMLDRKISILQKALVNNAFNQKLGILYFSLLFEKEYNSKLIMGKCLQFINANPSSISLWQFYFDLHFKEFRTFSYPYVRKIFQEINGIFKAKINDIKSAMEIWKVRKASLQILKDTLLVYKLSGYAQLATGLIMALIQFNIFMPEEVVQIANLQQKFKSFRQYWEDYDSYKLGQTNLGLNWSCLSSNIPQQKSAFIGDLQLQQPKAQNTRNPIVQQISKSRRVWRPSNSIRQKQIIQHSPQSFILIEDIDYALLLYRDPQSFRKLIDILADHLQLPPLFTTTTIYHQFNFKIIEITLNTLFTQQQHQTIGFGKQSFFWEKYWNPQFTALFLPKQNYVKLEYLRRVLNCLKQKMPTQKSSINEYLCFINCVIYTNPNLQQHLGISQSESSANMQEILKEQQLNSGVWSMYIEATYLLKHNSEDCLNCFTQLMQTAKMLIPSAEDQINQLYEILFWIFAFAYNHNVPIGKRLLKIYLKLINKEDIQQMELAEQLNPFDCLRIEQHFTNQLAHIATNQPSNHSRQSLINEKTKIPLFMMIYLQTYPYSNLHDKKEEMIKYFIALMLKEGSNHTDHKLFIVWALRLFGLLTIKHIQHYELLRETPYLSLVHYWINLYHKPLVLFQGYFDQLPYKNLVLWMSSAAFLWKRARMSCNFYEFFYTYSKKICFQDKLTEQYPQYIILLNSLLLYDVNEKHNKFMFYTLNHIPFSKELYLINLLVCEDDVQKRKLITLIEQKSIRILNPALLI